MTDETTIISTTKSATTMIQCEPCGCSTCEPGYRVSNPTAILFLQGDDEGDAGISCMDVEEQGLMGWADNNDDFCSDTFRYDPAFRSTCGCPDLPGPESSPVVVVESPPDGFNASTPLGADNHDHGGDNSIMNPILVAIQRNPILVIAIVVGAFAVAGIYLVCQLRRTQASEKASVEGTQGNDSDELLQPSPKPEGDPEDLELNNSNNNNSGGSPRGMIYILNDDDSISDFGSVMSYGVHL